MRTGVYITWESNRLCLLQAFSRAPVTEVIGLTYLTCKSEA